ncbi:MAG TPA: hypothetical protein VGJ81_11560 [Thermoanaerobaculia bacterium]|jgi:hypothetical protein
MGETRPVVLLGGAIAILAIFLSRFRPAWLLITETAQPALVAMVIVLAMLATGVGALFVATKVWGSGRNLKPEAGASGFKFRPDPLDAFIVGFPTFGTLIAIVAWIGSATHVAIAVVTFALAGAGLFILLKRPICAPRIPKLLIIPVVLAIVEAITPVNSPDELVYKLGVPHAYDMAGRMFEMPLSSHSYITMALQLADLAALILGGGIAAKLAHLALYFAALAVIRRLTNSDSITAIVAWTPALMLIAGWGWSEWGVIALLVLSIDRFDENPAIAFAALGGAVASKYTALPWLLAFAIVALVRTRDVKLLLRGALLVALFGGFFYVRNAVWTGSPLAPLFLPNAPGVYGYKGGGLFGGWRELIAGADIFDPRIVDESLGIVLPLAAICGLFALGVADRKQRDLAWIGAIQMPILITIAPGSRNIINGVVPLALAGGMSLLEWRTPSSAEPRDSAAAPRGRTWASATPILGGVIAIAFAAQLVLAIYVLDSYDIVPYLAGKETARQYVHRVRDFAPVYDWIETHTPPEAKILFLGENRTYDLGRQTLSGGNLDGPRIAAWLARFPNAMALHDELRRQRVTHILIHPAWLRPPKTMMEREYMLELPPGAEAALRECTIPVYRDNSYILVAVTPLRSDRL